MRPGHHCDDGVPLAEFAGNETAERADQNRITRTEHHMVTMRGEAVSLGDTLEAAADELPASNDRFEHRWDESAQSRPMDSLCAFPLTARDGSVRAVLSLCAEHTAVEIS